jgi:penicillin-binding protein 2
VAIGQGYVTTTPLQMAHAVAGLAVGRRYRPRLVLRLEGPDGAVVDTVQPEAGEDLDLKPGVLDEVRQGLIQVVNSPRGTGAKPRSRASSSPARPEPRRWWRSAAGG